MPRIDPNAVLARALDGLALRQQVTANNVANVDTPGFKASGVRFEEALRQALAPAPGGRLPLARTNPAHLPVAAPGAVEPEVVEMSGTALRNDGNNVDIEREMAKLAETQLRFTTVSESLARRFAMQRMVVTDGRG